MMRLNSSADFMAFLRAAKGCAGDVQLRTSNGDMLDLHSALCQMIAVVTLKKLRKADTVEIWCEDNGDYERLKEYLTE